MSHTYKYNPRQKAAYGIIAALFLIGTPTPVAFTELKLLLLIPFFYLAFSALKSVSTRIQIDPQKITTPKWVVNKDDVVSIRVSTSSGRGFMNTGIYFEDKHSNFFCIFGLNRTETDKILETLKVNNYSNIQTQN